MTTSLSPTLLVPNRPTPRPYRGGAGIERFRNLPDSGDRWAPEDFIASTVTTFGSEQEGLTVIGGVALRELIAADPLGYLGAEHVGAFGADPRLLCKLLHTGERLFVHVHPDGDYAHRELRAPSGKTEAWIILDVDEGMDGCAWLGFRDDVDESVLGAWYASQDSAAMLAAMNRVPLQAGDILHVPAGTAHSIGAGVLMLELQEPIDLSVILEYAPFERLDRRSSLLGLDVGTALRAVSRRALRAEDLADLIGHTPPGNAESFLPPASRPFFRVERVVVSAGADVELAAQFAVVVVTAGAGRITWADKVLAVSAGDTVLVPYGAGPTRVCGHVTLLRCMPPAASGSR